MIINVFLMKAMDVRTQTESGQPNGLLYKNHHIAPINMLNDMSAGRMNEKHKNLFEDTVQYRYQPWI